MSFSNFISDNPANNAMTAEDRQKYTKSGKLRQRAVIDKKELARVWREECARDTDGTTTTTAERVAKRLGTTTASTVTQTVTQLRKRLKEQGATKAQLAKILPMAPKFGRPEGGAFDVLELAADVDIELGTNEEETETASE